MGGPTALTPGAPAPKSVSAVCRKLTLGAGLAATAGYADVVCLSRYGCFAAMQTGNMIYLALALTHSGASGLYHAIPLACNFLGVALVGGSAVRRPWLIAPVGAPLLLAAFFAADLITFLGYGNKWLVCFPALAMGAQNTLTKEGELGLMTTLLTGNLQRVGLSLSMALHGDEIDWDEVLTVVTCLTVIFSTLFGAIVGASVILFFGETWTLLPAGILQFCCVVGYGNSYGPACLVCTRKPSEADISKRSSEGVALRAHKEPLLAAAPSAATSV